ncbi:MAG: bifunctional oligoribonuclease/PAP phosphatase NrnA [Prevotella sp.]|nr:bifunctional oligoribonuclease/PAP phosphatase NrnA [Prevotella sp.]
MPDHACPGITAWHAPPQLTHRTATNPTPLDNEKYPLQPVLDEQQLALMQRLIAGSDEILIVCHQNPDGDAIGSSLGMARLLAALGKTAQVVVPDMYPDYLMWLPGTQDITRYDKHREGCDFILQHTAQLIFCLDFNTTSRTGDMQQALDQSPATKILIDHHLAPTIASTVTLSRPTATSTCELVFRLAWQMGLFPQLDNSFAACIYCGMMTDTGAFTYNSSSPDVFFIISQLLTKGIDKDRIYRNVYHTYSEQRLRLTGYVLLKKMEVMHQQHAAFYSLSRQDLLRFRFVKGDAEGLVNMPLQMRGIKLSISLREDTEKEQLVWVSLRSVDNFPCNKMAEQYFAGGGHLNASGGRLHCSLDEAIDITRRAIVEFTGQFFNRPQQPQ